MSCKITVCLVREVKKFPAEHSTGSKRRKLWGQTSFGWIFHFGIGSRLRSSSIWNRKGLVHIFLCFFFLNSLKGPSAMGQPPPLLWEDLPHSTPQPNSLPKRNRFPFPFALNYISLNHTKMHDTQCRKAKLQKWDVGITEEPKAKSLLTEFIEIQYHTLQLPFAML